MIGDQGLEAVNSHPSQKIMKKNAPLELLQQLTATVLNIVQRCQTQQDSKQCGTCGDHFSSRDKLFKHLRQARHATFKQYTPLLVAVAEAKWDDVFTILKGAQKSPFEKQAAAEDSVDTGENALFLAVAQRVRLLHSPDTADHESADLALATISELIKMGANPRETPLAQKELKRKIEPIASQGRRRQVVGEALLLWDHHESYRGSPLALARACGDEEAAQVLTSNDIDECKVDTEYDWENAKQREMQWCTKCPRGVAYYLLPKGGEPFWECEDCGFRSCVLCCGDFKDHFDARGKRRSCEAVLQQQGYTLSSDFINRLHNTMNAIAKRKPEGLEKSRDYFRECRMIAKIASLQNKCTSADKLSAARALLKAHFREYLHQCIVCEEEELLVLPSRTNNCSHHVCSECMVSWIRACLDDRKSFISCPFPKCKTRLQSEDVKRIAGTSCAKEFEALMAADHTNRLLQLMENEKEFKMVTDGPTRCCPKCRVIVFRYSGCDDFQCTCGARFHFSNQTWPTMEQLKKEIASR
eukprot:m.16719 g.16719  ORF g.16719 m.16719 type:complete len:528 (+) comp5771_c0_seq1:344-1927(+)